jgi:hypothetical protein
MVRTGCFEVNKGHLDGKCYILSCNIKGKVVYLT